MIGVDRRPLFASNQVADEALSIAEKIGYPVVDRDGARATPWTRSSWWVDVITLGTEDAS